MGFSQGISGLSAAAANLDVIGNNIANSGTVGFKSGAATFQDVYAGSRVGLGVAVSGIVQNFTQGSVQTSSRPLDVAILNGDGFFRLSSPSGEVMYSRNGQFTRDKDGFIVNAAGLRLTGYGVSATGGLDGGTPGPLQVQTTAMSPKATTAINATFNLDARGTVPTKTPFSATDSATFNYSNALGPVFDSLGNPHELGVFFVKTGANAWDVYGAADGSALNGGAPISTMSFDGNGNLLTPAGGKLTLPAMNFGNGSVALNATVDLSGTTQFGNVNEIKTLKQDGYTSGTLTSFSINPDGTITGKFSNEQTTLMGQVVLTSFANPNGLEPMGENVWGETLASGQPLTGTPGAGTKQGSLASGALEASNVDLTSELVNLIVAQRSYQANAQTVKTQDQVVQTLINIR
ncbi:flagellar hook protein FlgE [Variovorax sp. V59]|jgi:flagellar hook protein FlgE|uniref:Flagellar hook protein FlgE n=2 Tax=Variovorax TaxID=34072 RepID=A0AAE3XYK1_VARPD|nr:MULTISPECIES: flagellar hook protein FlgE [Variovorax]MBD9662727.1 flagellar hook protein FlgE [Variovorax sp. VRV01]MBW8717737.1 flagellar hook protein FlgE [Variovorax paradoxus]MDP9967824.1 flagellar hook protein FlgE [Variovorax paradoxus]MDP9973361.1 flagellar hook protein FlgE [Variovorax paradoxus]MDR6427239.1 flagellar hook protein FlgE [Variovorax paradoxus]